MGKRATLKDFKKEAFLDEKLRNEYELLRPEFEMIEKLIVARKSANLSQEDVAKRLHTRQPAIARLEGGGFKKTSISKLMEYVDVLGYSLKLDLIPKEKRE